jgi:hypothetical protein
MPLHYADEILLLNGCDALFQVQRAKNGDCKIGGVCNILLSSIQTDEDETEHLEDPDIVSRFIRRNYFFDKQDIQQIIKLEAVLKRLDIWEDDKYPSTTIPVGDSMISEAAMEAAFTALLNRKYEIPKESAELSHLHSGVSELDTEGLHNESFPISSQVKWLQTRLSFWHDEASWMKIETLRGIYSEWLRWRLLRANLESHFFAWVSGAKSSRIDGTKKSLDEFKRNIDGDVSRLVLLTSNLIDQLVKAIEVSQARQCWVRIGKKRLDLLKRTRLPKQIEYDLEAALFEVLTETYTDPRTDLKTGVLANFYSNDSYYSFTDWDWSEMELLFESLAPVDERKTLDLQCGCSSRLFLRTLQPQERTWKRIDIF